MIIYHYHNPNYKSQRPLVPLAQHVLYIKIFITKNIEFIFLYQ